MLRIDTLSTAQPPDVAMAQTKFCLIPLVKLPEVRGIVTVTMINTHGVHALDELDPGGENAPVLQELGPVDPPTQ